MVDGMDSASDAKGLAVGVRGWLRGVLPPIGSER